MRDGHAVVDKSVYVLETKRPEDDISVILAKDLPPKTNHVAAPCDAPFTTTTRNGKHALASQKASEVKTLLAAKESEPPVAKVVEPTPEAPPVRTVPKAKSTPNGSSAQNGTSETSAKKIAKPDTKVEAKPEAVDVAGKQTKRAEARAKARARAGARTESRPESRTEVRPETRLPRVEADVEDNAELLGQDDDEFDGDLDDATGLSFEELLRQEKAFFKTHQAEKQSFPRARDKESKKNRF